MKTRIAIVVATVALLLLGSVALSQTVPKPSAGYSVAPGAASGGGYHLTSLAWQVRGTTSGGGYRLLGPVRPTLRGSGCCCVYLPGVRR